MSCLAVAKSQSMHAEAHFDAVFEISSEAHRNLVPLW